MYSVYALVDPRDDLPFSLGVTDDVYKRFAQHLQCNGTNLDNNERIQELKNEHLMLIMRTIEVLETIEED
jgi:predicted GIY-YIG superfamily endonuclease